MDDIVRSYGAFLSATAIGLVIAAMTWYAARKSGLQPVQAELIENLQDNAAALNVRVERLKEDLEAERQRRISLSSRVEQLENLVVELVAENTDLRKRLDLPRRSPNQPESGAPV